MSGKIIGDENSKKWIVASGFFFENLNSYACFFAKLNSTPEGLSTGIFVPQLSDVH
ncbi:hypothetical protein [Algoriphagus sp.]|uniref:hypothetical protein n=1 Tax=Algoriphagus sp. TaxID=1872435 RepID=UPI0026258198|nr:hypothetical protein [Algoriphagus sp.]